MTCMTRRSALRLALGATLAPLGAGMSRAASHAAATVTISGFAFQPAMLTIEVGTSVTFVNADSAPHTATGQGFDTGRLGRGDEATLTFAQPGTYDYVCRFHPAMTGRITVT
ncbi:cupredoxin family copper-binding protein [Thalassococcus sp. CAU 1522]|uniref:Cupredoxin family copper-binding protein n=1 Tax=Thalassococcus arenae TaxID=2851652 RepID=A0ABS6N4R8_9RHOB|nr:cupredoxin family copper-binding protein [Thalassococcus arenae]MBV2359006.1 cupredoxin family copper-binding protein [Thalassococcus arenae]